MDIMGLQNTTELFKERLKMLCVREGGGGVVKVVVGGGVVNDTGRQ